MSIPMQYAAYLDDPYPYAFKVRDQHCGTAYLTVLRATGRRIRVGPGRRSLELEVPLEARHRVGGENPQNAYRPPG